MGKESMGLGKGRGGYSTRRTVPGGVPWSLATPRFRHVGKYRLLRRISKGIDSDIFLAEDDSGALFALKRQGGREGPKGDRAPNLRDMAEHEAEVLCRCGSHSNIV